jgi:hypothetical protein
MSVTADFFRRRHCARKVALRVKILRKIKNISGNEFGLGLGLEKIREKNRKTEAL